MRFLIAILITAVSGAGLEGLTADNARDFFQAVYDPQVHYDRSGNVLMGGCPLTAGHIEPDWDAAVCEKVGKGRKSHVEFRVPISVEREIWTILSDDHERYPVKELAECELVISCKKNDTTLLWDTAIRYRIADPVAAGNRRFSGLVIDVDPNTFAPLSLTEYQNGSVVLEEDNLGGYRWVYKRRPTIVQIRNDIHRRLPDMVIGEGGIQIFSAYHVLMPGAQPLYGPTGQYVQVISSPAVSNALRRYRYFPVTIRP